MALPARAVEAGGNRFERRGASRHHGHAGAERSQLGSARAADSLASAAHQRPLTGKVHVHEHSVGKSGPFGTHANRFGTVPLAIVGTRITRGSVGSRKRDAEIAAAPR